MKLFRIISNSTKDPKGEYKKLIYDYLCSRGAEVTDDGFADIVVVLGGDGTLLKAVRECNHKDTCFIGINIGTLGFLTDSEFDQFKAAIDCILEDNYVVDERMMISGRIIRDGQTMFESIALNDIVINRAGNLRIIQYDVYVNDEYLSSYSADGAIISTATGSTAYNLSAGGPIVQPNAKIFLFTPVCPHTINKSSIVFGRDDKVVIKMCDPRKLSMQSFATFDGEQFFEVVSGDEIVIEKSDIKAKLIKTNKDSFLLRVREKLM